QQPANVYEGTDSGLLKSTDGGTTWTRSGLNQMAIVDLAINPSTPTTLLAIAGSTGPPDMYRSLDAGANWTKAASLVGQRVAIAPSNPSVAYATSNGNLLRSADGGATWTSLPTPAYSYGDAVVVDPTNANVVYVSTGINQLLKTTDGGSTWTTLTVTGAT